MIKAIKRSGGACMNNKNSIDRVHDEVFNSIKTLMDKARNEVAREVNNVWCKHTGRLDVSS